MPRQPTQKYTSGYLYYVTATVEDLEEPEASDFGYDDDEDPNARDFSTDTDDLNTMFPTRLVTRLDPEDTHAAEDWVQVDFAHAVASGDELYVCIALYQNTDNSLESCVALVTSDMDEADAWVDQVEEQDLDLDCAADVIPIRGQVYNMVLR